MLAKLIIHKGATLSSPTMLQTGFTVISCCAGCDRCRAGEESTGNACTKAVHSCLLIKHAEGKGTQAQPVNSSWKADTTTFSHDHWQQLSSPHCLQNLKKWTRTRRICCLKSQFCQNTCTTFNTLHCCCVSDCLLYNNKLAVIPQPLFSTHLPLA